MTAVAMPVAAPTVRTDSLGRIFHAARLHAANPWGTLILPWLIMLAIFATSNAIWRLIAMSAGGVDKLEPDAFVHNGGGFWALFYMMVVAIQAMNLTFKFALGVSLTRREYYLGTAGYFAMLSVLYAAGWTVGAVIERATDGWGLNGAFFIPSFVQDEPIWLVGFVWLTLYLFFMFVGAAVATIFVRWASNGLVTFFAVLTLALIGGVWAIVKFDWGGSIVAWFTHTSLFGIFAWTLVPTALFAVVGYLLMRRATPRA
jgi:hypothetical protein